MQYTNTWCVNCEKETRWDLENENFICKVCGTIIPKSMLLKPYSVLREDTSVEKSAD